MTTRRVAPLMLIDPSFCDHADSDLEFVSHWPELTPDKPYLHNCTRCGTSVVRSYRVIGGIAVYSENGRGA